ncbi:hypothetical protein J2129_001444 [Methanofollis sp. W23]|nr:hypothetical protein [Methanofollis sp. W23]
MWWKYPLLFVAHPCVHAFPHHCAGDECRSDSRDEDRGGKAQTMIMKRGLPFPAYPGRGGSGGGEPPAEMAI